MNNIFYKKIKDFKNFLTRNIDIIDKNITKRQRKITLKHIIYTCFNKFINHTSYDIEVGELNKNILDIDKNISTQGFNQRKNKIDNKVFLELNNNILNDIYKNKNKNKRHILVDGSHLHLYKTLKKYGFKDGSSRCTYTKCIISAIKDYDNNIPINYEINKNMNEREAFEKQLNYIEKSDILIFDRGYPSNNLLKILSDKNFNYILRYKKDNIYTKYLIKNNLEEYHFNINNKNHKIVKYNINEKSYFLYTNLIDMSINDLKNNYKKRWDIESHFKDLKYTTSIGNITSKTENTVLQELYINNLIYILISYFKKLFIEDLFLKYSDKYKLNNIFCIKTFFKDILNILLFKNLNKHNIKNILKCIFIISEIKYYNKENRSYERTIKGPINKWINLSSSRK
jgi:hypothetical protein